jgi:hypothetical protein
LAQQQKEPVIFGTHAPPVEIFETWNIENRRDYRWSDPMISDANAGNYAM